MKAVLQRARGASVSVEGAPVGSFEGEGIVALVGIHHDDTPAQATEMARKIANLRMLTGERSALDAGAPVLLISQFTLYGDTRKGRRPSWSAAMPGSEAEPLVDAVAEGLRGLGIHVETGRFGAEMDVSLTNQGPFTLIVEVS